MRIQRSTFLVAFASPMWKSTLPFATSATSTPFPIFILRDAAVSPNRLAKRFDLFTGYVLQREVDDERLDGHAQTKEIVDGHVRRRMVSKGTGCHS